MFGKNGIYFGKMMGYIWKSYGKYWAKIMGYITGYIGQILGDIFGKTMGYTVPLDIFNKTNGCLGNIMGYIGKKLWDILWDIFAKPWDRIYWYIGYIKQKLRDLQGKIMGYIWH